jgi:hypothetical protein
MSSTKTRFFLSSLFDTIMRKYVEVPEEVLARLVEGKCIEGSLRRDQWTGVLTFRAFNRKPRGSQDKVICQLENGWLKESPKRIKFFNSVNKNLDLLMIDHVMKRELKTAMRALLGDKLTELLMEEERDGLLSDMEIIDRV